MEEVAAAPRVKTVLNCQAIRGKNILREKKFVNLTIIEDINLGTGPFVRWRWGHVGKLLAWNWNQHFSKEFTKEWWGLYISLPILFRATNQFWMSCESDFCFRLQNCSVPATILRSSSLLFKGLLFSRDVDGIFVILWIWKVDNKNYYVVSNTRFVGKSDQILKIPNFLTLLNIHIHIIK